jgi:CBS domain-containing protein
MKTVAELLRAKPTRAIVKVTPELSVLEAIKILATENIGAAVVMSGDRLAGILSERDYTRKVILKGRSSAETAAWEIMSSPVQTVGPDDTVNTCMRLMTERRFRHLPVVEGERVAGMLSIGDLVRAVIEEQQQEIAQLQQYITAG